MASVTLKPDPQRFPIGTVLKVFAKPGTPYDETVKPPGAEVTSGTVEVGAPQNSVTFSGLTEGSSYIAWSSSSGPLKFTVRVAVSPGSGISKAEAEALIKEAIAAEAVSTASPAFTGNPTAPTQAAGNNSTRLATTAYADGAVATETTARGTAVTGEASARATADGLLLVKTANLSDVANAATARTSLGLGSAAVLASGAFDAAGVAATAQAAAELASQVRQGVHALVEANATAEPDVLTPVSAEGATRKIKLPEGLGKGRLVILEKSDATTNEVIAEGNIRGVAAQSLALKLSKQTVAFMTDAAGSWWPFGDHTTQASLKEAYGVDIITKSIYLPPATAIPNEELGGFRFKAHRTGEKWEIVYVTHQILTSGTINLAVKNGAAGATEIAAYKKLESTTSKQTTTSTQELTDGDRVTVTGSGGASPKGIEVDVGIRVTAP